MPRVQHDRRKALIPLGDLRNLGKGKGFPDLLEDARRDIQASPKARTFFGRGLHKSGNPARRALKWFLTRTKKSEPAPRNGYSDEMSRLSRGNDEGSIIPKINRRALQHYFVYAGPLGVAYVDKLMQGSSPEDLLNYGQILELGKSLGPLKKARRDVLGLLATLHEKSLENYWNFAEDKDVQRHLLERKYPGLEQNGTITPPYKKDGGGLEEGDFDKISAYLYGSWNSPDKEEAKTEEDKEKLEKQDASKRAFYLKILKSTGKQPTPREHFETLMRTTPKRLWITIKDSLEYESTNWPNPTILHNIRAWNDAVENHLGTLGETEVNRWQVKLKPIELIIHDPQFYTQTDKKDLLSQLRELKLSPERNSHARRSISLLLRDKQEMSKLQETYAALVGTHL